MRCEIPEVGRCCFCFPLRLGLLVWSYTKLIASVMLLTTMMLNLVTNWDMFWRRMEIIFVLQYVTFLISLATDVVFLIVFVVSAHKKDPRIMNWFLKFSYYMFAMYALCLCFSIAYAADTHHFFSFYIGFTTGCICFICLVFQVYVIILVRSEVMKLKRGTNLEFVNQGADTTSVKAGANCDP